jgi:hypothetical protein
VRAYTRANRNLRANPRADRVCNVHARANRDANARFNSASNFNANDYAHTHARHLHRARKSKISTRKIFP